MKHSEAERHIRAMYIGLMRLRSIVPDELKLDPEQASRAFGEIDPWVWGKKCPLPTLQKVVDALDDGRKIEASMFYNLIVIATRLAPAIGFAASMYDIDFPKEGDINWFRGWEAEHD